MNRITKKRLLWLGLAFLAWIVFWVVHQRIILTSRQEYPPFRATFDAHQMSKNKSSIAPENSFRERVNRSSDHANGSHTREPVHELDKMTAAAVKFEAAFVSPRFQFSNDVYFRPNETGPQRDFFRYLINPLDTRSGGAETSKDSPFMIVLVLSSYLEQASEERSAIRETYGSVTHGQPWPTGGLLSAPVRLVFVLGRPPTTRDRQLVNTESAEHGDLLVVDFVDSYQNLTSKVLHGLHWVLRHCPRARFVLKADDDVFVNLPLLTAFLLKRGSNNSVYGHAYFGSAVLRGGHWAVPLAAYPFPRYPAYMSGTSYAMSTDAAQKIVQASRRLPLVPIEDAFITGILPQITGVRRMTCPGFTHFLEERPHDCEFVNNERFIGNKMDADEKMALWVTMETDHLVQKCGGEG